MSPTYPSQVWRVDLTDIRVTQGCVYLAYALDSFTREIVGWAVSKCIDAALALRALNNAPQACCPAPGLLHHSDQESQYGSRVYVDRLREAGLMPNMSREGNPYDNARMASFYTTLKTEEADLQDDRDFDDVQRHSTAFIGQLHNEERLHSSLGSVPPAEFATQYHGA
ncbi:DDE-type integrase/transposase/recombinase [Deinococcus sp. Arct2-2]|uniref:DDE-type integrase/transposase/recombinase n=1 Tax=Deinococcus sp. Arct2-2 TaxID=2568653 RepID=UPI0023EF4D03|nr:DDE-type integrase/transposase/recombinase [Deinococcus sp. Arct2-2]